MTADQKRTGDWTGDQWAPDDTTDEAAVAHDTRAGERDRWQKTQWPGDQGEGAPGPVDPDAMPEGESAISGDRHAPGEQHWAGDPDRGGEHAGDRPLER